MASSDNIKMFADTWNHIDGSSLSRVANGVSFLPRLATNTQRHNFRLDPLEIA